MNDYMSTQKIHDFTPGNLVRIRDDYKKFGDDTAVPGALYRVTDVNVISESQGSGTLGLDGVESKSHWAPRFGHMILDPNIGDLRVGDRVKATDKRTLIGPDYLDKVGTITKVYDDGRFDVDFGGGRWTREALEPLAVNESVQPADDAPDLSDSEVRRGLPLMEAYPVGSVWNHFSSGDEPVTILGPDPYDDKRLMVHAPTYISQTPYEGSWIRGALDTYGTLVSLPENSDKADEAQATIHALRGDVERLTKRVSDLEGERSTLTQAASDERRRLVAEIDALKIERDAALDDRAAYKQRLKASEARSDEGWNAAARHLATLDYARKFLGVEQDAMVRGFADGIAEQQ